MEVTRRSVVVVDALRTPSGRRNGSLAGSHPVDLAAHVLRALARRTGIDPAVVDDVIVGCVTQVGEQSTNIGRNAVLAAGWPESVPGTTVDRQCGSSQQAVHFAAQGIAAGAYDVAVAAGVEVMSTVPMFSNAGGDLALAYGPAVAARYAERETLGVAGIVPQGLAAEALAVRCGFGREALDRFAVRSHDRARMAHFGSELEAVAGLALDETIRETSLEQLAALRPAFVEGGRTTAGNSSPITDGAAAVLLAGEDVAERLGLEPLGRVVAGTVRATDPVAMLTAPAPATLAVLERAGLRMDAIDRFEVNEAFASVVLAWQEATGADPDRVNPEGGAIALGHPLGASGARLLTTLVHGLRRSGLRYGLQTMCEGGGMANALVVEAL